MNSRQQAKRKSWHSMSKTIQQQQKKYHRWKLEGQRSKKKKIEGLVIPPIPLIVSGTSPSPIKIEAQPNYFIKIFPVGQYDREFWRWSDGGRMRVQSCNVRRCDTKAFMKAICDGNNISLDGQFGALPYLLEKWSASLTSACVASWRQGLHSGIDPTVRTQSCKLLEVISGSFTQGSFRRLLCWWLRPSHHRDKAVEQRWGDSQHVARGWRFWKRIGGTLGSKTRPILTFLCVSPVQSEEMPPDSMCARVESLHEFLTLHDAVLDSCTCQRVVRGEDECKTRRLIPKKLNSWSESEDSFRFF